MLARRCFWKFLAAVFFAFGIIPAGPLWLVSKLGALCFRLANLFMAPFELCRTVARGKTWPLDVKVKASPRWRIVRSNEVRVADVVARGRGRR